MLSLILSVAIITAFSEGAPLKFDLGGAWQAVNFNGTLKIPAQVPGEIHTDLMRNNIIGDPYYRFNDNAYNWVAKDNWTYSRSFTLSSDFLSQRRIELVVEGLDTVANVTLNNKLVLSTDNQFRSYIVDVTTGLLSGTNAITVNFESALSYADRQAAASSVSNPPDCPPDVQNGFCHINYIRKEPCSFSWDWGPAFAPQGIWRPIYLQAYPIATIRYVVVETKPAGTNWDLTVTAGIYSTGTYSGELSLNLGTLLNPTEKTKPSQNIRVSPLLLHAFLAPFRACSSLLFSLFFSYFSFFNISPLRPHSSSGSLGSILASSREREAQVTQPVNLQAGDNKVTISLTGVTVQRWDPVGYGVPNRYPITLSLAVNNVLVDTATKNIGFRTVQLRQDAMPGGTSFYFRVNDVPVYVKGANWIPADSFESRVTTGVLRDLFLSYKEANFNTLRVWGGGIYQQDAFYDLADEFGLLIWQEFIFACALYPTDSSFLNTVAQEVKDNILRLQFHPSIILWSGNNENEAAIAQNWYGTSDNRQYYINQYGTLYFDTVLSNLSLYDSTRPTAGSSPSNGDETASHPVDDDPQSSWTGDVHYYNYDADCWDVTNYPRTRFTSEYGFQSFPSFISLAGVSNGSQGDWDWDSTFTAHRQHHDYGNNQIINQLYLHFHIPNSTDTKQKYIYTLFMSQVMHGQCIKTETEHYRRIMTECNDQNSGCNMGTLYWQANDIWQGASWSSLEFGGRWKVLHYLAKQFYNPILASMFIHSGNGGIYVVNETPKPLTGTLTLTMWSWNSLTPLSQWSTPFNQMAFYAASVYTFTLTDLLSTGKCPDVNQCVLTYQITDPQNVVLSSNHYFLSSLSTVTNLQNPSLSITDVQEVTSSPDYAHTFSISFNSKAVAAFVWLETSYAGHYSDNGFLWTPSSPSSVYFYTHDPSLTASTLKSSLTIWSIWDTYTH